MSNANHTPGPWHIEGPDQFGDYNILHPGDSLAIAAVVSNLRPSNEVKANASFIIRACNSHDELVAALRDVTRILEAVRYQAGIGDKQMERIKKARAVIAKAEEHDHASAP